MYMYQIFIYQKFFKNDYIACHVANHRFNIIVEKSSRYLYCSLIQPWKDELTT